jgi:hypothetical protein
MISFWISVVPPKFDTVVIPVQLDCQIHISLISTPSSRGLSAKWTPLGSSRQMNATSWCAPPPAPYRPASTTRKPANVAADCPPNNRKTSSEEDAGLLSALGP